MNLEINDKREAISLKNRAISCKSTSYSGRPIQLHKGFIEIFDTSIDTFTGSNFLVHYQLNGIGISLVLVYRDFIAWKTVTRFISVIQYICIQCSL